MPLYFLWKRLVPDNCYPWESGRQSECRVRTLKKRLEAACPVNPQSERALLHRVGPVYRIDTEKGIMYEIMKSGPVQGKKKSETILNCNKSSIFERIIISTTLYCQKIWAPLSKIKKLLWLNYGKPCVRVPIKLRAGRKKISFEMNEMKRNIASLGLKTSKYIFSLQNNSLEGASFKLENKYYLSS